MTTVRTHPAAVHLVLISLQPPSFSPTFFKPTTPPFPSNQMLTPEIRPQIHNLPSPQPHQHRHSSKSKPLDPLVRALIRIPQLLLATAQIIHFRNDLAHDFLDATEFGFDGLQLLAGLDCGPVFGVGADVNVEFDVAGRVRAAADFCGWSLEGWRWGGKRWTYCL